MLDADTGAALMVDAAPPLPVDRLIVGLAVEEAAALLPRIFNLCRHAQEAAARLAFGLPLDDGTEARLRDEILRDHVLKTCLKWPGHFGGASVALPADWRSDRAALARALFGPDGRMPQTQDDLAAFLAGGQGLGPVLARIDACFARGEAVCPELAPITSIDAALSGPVENSVAARQAAHPVMRAVERDKGRGPFWRALGRACDLDALLSGARLDLDLLRPGCARVTAARGAYTVAATVTEGRVQSFARVTPTDHLSAPGGILDHVLATLPAHKTGLAPLLIDILDPCAPLRLKEAAHA